MIKIRKQILKKIRLWRKEALEILPTAEFRFFWPSFKLLEWICSLLELDRKVLMLGVRIIRDLVITMHNRQSYYIPGIVGAIINRCADYIEYPIPRSHLREFMEISVQKIRDEGMKIEDMVDLANRKVRLI